ncbi:hypothetical protein [Burkholderia ubonensis]|uniref:hypothetical protein n=1 Tax=Burkholderia ubonensis TaxID=101571 RepID=UPI0012FCC583|nr:hypothetical protein [Burkholderia ubonensis]
MNPPNAAIVPVKGSLPTGRNILPKIGAAANGRVHTRTRDVKTGVCFTRANDGQKMDDMNAVLGVCVRQCACFIPVAMPWALC